MKITLFFIIVSNCLYTSLMSQSRNDSVFVQFAQLEDLYKNGVIYDTWEIENIYKKDRAPKISPQQLDSIVNNLKNVLFFNDESELSVREFKSIPYPFEIITSPVSDTVFDLKMKVLVPKYYKSIYISQTDIGKEFMVDNVMVKLLKVENNTGIFMLQGKNKRRDYLYTTPGYKEEDDNDEDVLTDEQESDPDTVIPPLKFGWIESFYADGFYRHYKNNSVLQFEIPRIRFNVCSKESLPLYFNFQITDFHHYLWYRTVDMPYHNFSQYYSWCKENYVEEDSSSNYQFYPINIVNVRASGIINGFEFIVQSDTTSVKEYSLGQISRKKPEVYKMDDCLPVENFTDAEIKSRLKVYQQCNKVFMPENEPTPYVIYAYLANNFNTNSWKYDVRFDELEFITESGDTIPVDRKNKKYNSLETGMFLHEELKYITQSIAIDNPGKPVTQLKGTLRYEYNYFEEKYFQTDNLPEDITYSNKTLYIDYANYLDAVDFIGFDENGLQPDVSISRLSSYKLLYNFHRDIVKFKIIMAGKKIEGSVPFVVDIQKNTL